MQMFDPPHRSTLNMLADFWHMRRGSVQVVERIESGETDQFHKERDQRLAMHRGFVTSMDPTVTDTTAMLPACCQL